MKKYYVQFVKVGVEMCSNLALNFLNSSPDLGYALDRGIRFKGSRYLLDGL